ncbi:hypothetical protein MTO96_012263 [Rhipicephalus appendiculatus]
MLRHYENECAFHTVECLQCGEEVLHRELSTHYFSGCSAAVPLARAENARSDSQALTLQDVTAALEEVKTLLRDANHEQLLLASQSQMNELTEQIRNHESMLVAITRAVAAPATTEMAQITAPSTSTSLQEGTSRQNPTEEPSTSSTSRSCLEQTLMPRQLEPLVDLPREVLQAMRRTSTEEYPQHAISYFEACSYCQLLLARPLLTTATWREIRGSVKYVLTLHDIPNDHGRAQRLALITVLHTRDAYFTVEVGCNSRTIRMGITFHG